MSELKERQQLVLAYEDIHPMRDGSRVQSLKFTVVAYSGFFYLSKGMGADLSFLLTDGWRITSMTNTAVLLEKEKAHEEAKRAADSPGAEGGGKG